MKYTRALFSGLAERHGLTLEYVPGRTVHGRPRAAEIMLDAPRGKVFNSSGCHCDGSLSHDNDEDGTRTDWRRAFVGLWVIIDAGLSDCPDGEACDVCNPQDLTP